MAGNTTATTTAPTSAAAAPPPSSSAPPTTSAALVSSAPAATSVPVAAIDTLTTAIYGLQRQMGQVAARIFDLEGRPPTDMGGSMSPLYGMPGYGGLPLAPATSSIVVHTSALNRSVPIHQISFPHSPSPIPPFVEPPPVQQGYQEDHGESIGVPRFHKLTFPTFDGREDPIGWLNRCDHFFRAQRTREADKVWLASFHMTGNAQQWYFMLERDVGDVGWPHFKAFCQQRFGPAVGTNHLADLARLPFRGSVEDYQEAFLARMAHAGYLAPTQQVAGAVAGGSGGAGARAPSRVPGSLRRGDAGAGGSARVRLGPAAAAALARGPRRRMRAADAARGSRWSRMRGPRRRRRSRAGAGMRESAAALVSGSARRRLVLCDVV
ncbi:unnamed protein product [Urochloa humidicola]